MFKLEGKLKFVNVNLVYLQYLHEVCSEVYFKSEDYENKPYLGVLLSQGNRKYVLPLTSAKEKHKLWRNAYPDRFLIYAIENKNQMAKQGVYVDIEGGDTVKHIFAAVDLKKMIPVTDDVLSSVDINSHEDDSDDVKKYKDLLNKEYSFCIRIVDDILTKASRIYDKQMTTGKVTMFSCDFRALETAADIWRDQALKENRQGKTVNLTYITGNYGKYISVKERFEKAGIDIKYSQGEFNEPDVDDIKTISKEKARQAYDMIGTPVFVIDSGFYIEHYPDAPGYPGAFVKRSGISSHVADLLEKMKDVEDRSCYFLDCLTFFDGKDYYQFLGTKKGSLSEELRGGKNIKAKSDLWYVFIPRNCNKTMAEMSDEERDNRPDGRTDATEEFIEWYVSRLNNDEK